MKRAVAMLVGLSILSTPWSGIDASSGNAWMDAPEPVSAGDVMWAHVYQTPESASFGSITSYSCGSKSVFGTSGSTGGVNLGGGDRLGVRYIYFASSCGASQAGTWDFDTSTYRFRLANGYYRYAGELVAPASTTTSSTSTTSTTSSTSTTIAEVSSITNSITGARRTRNNPTTTTVEVAEDDGIVEEDYAEIAVRTIDKKFEVRVYSSLSGTEMTIRARSASRPTITWEFRTSESGQRRFLTSRSLKGYVLSLWVDGERMDSLRVK